MQRSASETMNQPGSQSSGEPPSAGKAVARPAGARGKDVGGVRPLGAALTGGMRPRGAPGPMTAPDLRSSRLRLRVDR